ncbi:GDP dissociation inhibitor [Cokeromyces recurvatus]|uniref:GDP dissociation inhibitor n=1 Tax=Cokeromyces recurvatus TaxID=90255 RepID=UPI00221F0ECF|nr:GDP dissociation inhibitor [Cokeromyces recurvatus]KAI7902413.1 GDP dissociation inhibitor [Cokeromyces recurvatus]
MSDDLEEINFDYIVLGTGLIESILAGSLARIGKKVLHLDSHQHYGSNWSVFGFRELIKWYLDRTQEIEEQVIEGDLSINYERSYSSNFKNVQLKICGDKLVTKELEEGNSAENLSKKPSNEADKALFDAYFKLTSSTENELPCEMKLFNYLLKNSRSYNLDTTPKLLGAREELVDILIRSGVGRYLEFRNVDDVYIFDDSIKFFEKVPSSKEDVFTNKSVSLVEKRKLMKFLTFAMEYDIKDPLFEGTDNLNYGQFLTEKFKITGKLKNAIIYAIALVNEKVSIKHGLDRTHQFVRAMGRFGKGAYLCPLYGGASEIAQAFCRVCAVYGGIYILNEALERYVIDEKTNKCTGIITKEGKEYKGQKIIAGIDYLNYSWLPHEDNLSTWISRAILVTDTRLETINCEGLSYSIFPPGSEAGNIDEPIYGIHQNDEIMACPKNQYVTYLWTTSKNEDALKKAIDLLTSQGKQPFINVFYKQRVRNLNMFENSGKLPKNIIPCSDPDATLDFETAIKEARNLFYECESSDAEFMPSVEQENEDTFD